MKKRLLPALLALALVLTLLPMSVFGAESKSGRTYLEVEKVDSADGLPGQIRDGSAETFERLENPKLDPDETVRVSIVLDKASTIGAGYSTQSIAANAGAMSYRDGLRREQVSVQQAIETKALGGQKLDVVWNLTLAANIISANVRRGDIEAIADVDGVKEVVEEMRFEPQVVSVGGELKPNMAISGAMNGAQDTWDMGYYGAGSKIAIIDTGLDTDHQSFDAGAFNQAISQQKNVDLLTVDEIAAVLDQLNISDTVTAEQLYRTTKVPYGYNYVDRSLEITHDHDSQGEHGSHVAGIAAANRFIPKKDDSGKVIGYDKAIDTVKVVGDAPDAQLLIMKVFGTKGGAYTADYMAAIEDAIVLGADAVNLSLGSAVAGMTTDPQFQDIMDDLVNSDTVVIMSAGNNGSWADGTGYGSYGLYNDGVNFDTVGSPGSYGNSFTVASVDNDGTISPAIKVNGSSYQFNEGAFDEDPRTDLPLFTSLDTTEDGSGTSVPFVMMSIDDRGHEEEAMKALKDTVKDKIAIVWRGSINFGVKAQAAANAGAKGVIIANVPGYGEPAGLIPQLDGYTGDAPVAAVTKPSAEAIWDAFSDNAEEYTYEVDGESETGTYITGTITVFGSPVVDRANADHYTMSSFSAWGVPGDLSLKPEITAPGGNIWSVNGAIAGGKDYELMSGTSMAAPQIAGLSALIQQYLRDKDIDEGITSRALTQSLLMSTAKPMTDEDGNYYPVIQQGAGLADAGAAVATPAYITMPGSVDGKVKAELGDDPAREGVYTVDFTVHNMTDDDLFYAFDVDAFTQAYRQISTYKFTQYNTRALDVDVSFTADGIKLVSDDPTLLKYDFNGDGNVDKRDAALLLDLCMGQIDELPHNAENGDLNGDGVINTYDVHKLLALGNAYATVPAHGSVDVTATIILSDEEKATLAEQNPAGAYIEAYIFAKAMATPEGVMYPELSLPVLGWYGSWTEPSMYDCGGYFEGLQVRPYLFSVTMGNTNFLSINNDTMRTPSGSAIGDGVDVSYYYYTLIRNAGGGLVRVTDSETGEVYFEAEQSSAYAAYYPSGSSASPRWSNIRYTAGIKWKQTDMDGNKLPSGTKVTVSLIMAPEYYAEEDGTYDWDKLLNGIETEDDKELHDGAFLKTELTVDTKAPEIITEGEDAPYAEYVTEDDGKDHLHIFAKAKDDVSLVEFDLLSETEEGYTPVQAFSDTIYNTSFDPIFEPTGPDEVASFEFDGYHELDYNSYFGYLDYGKEGDLEPGVYLIDAYDLAGNETTYRIFAKTEPTHEVDSVEIVDEYGEPIEAKIELLKGEQFQLDAIVNPYTLEDRGVNWSSSDESVATVDENGVVTAVAAGEVTVTATAKEDNKATDELTISVYSLPITFTGVLQDVNGDPTLFTWNFDAGTMDYKRINDSFSISNAALEDEESFWVFDSGNSIMTERSTKDGTAIGEPITWSSTSPTPWAMDFSADSAFNWTYGYYVFVEDDVEEPSYMAFDFSALDMPYFFGITGVNEKWTATSGGEKVSGDLILYLIDDSNNVWCLKYYEGHALRTIYPSTLDVSVSGYGDDPMSNLTYGPDGALYYSAMTGDTNEVFRLTFDKDSETWIAKRIGDFGDDVWPALIFEAKNNGETPAAINGWNEDDAVEVNAVSVDPAELEKIEFAKSETSAVPSGSLNAIDTGEKTTEAKTSGVTINKDTKTVTVPVYTDSTNGKATVQYDTRILTLTDVAAGNADVFDYNLIDATDTDTTKPVLAGVELGFGDRTNVNGKVAELTFKFNSYVNTNLTLTTTEDGASTAPVSLTVPVKLSSASDRRPGGSIGGGGAVTPPPSTTEPSEPDNPGEDEPTPGTPAENKFVDVPENNWYTDAVNTLVGLGIIKGTTDTTFAPYQNIDRQSIAAIIYRMAGEPETDGLFTFKDVANGNWATDPIAWISGAGYMKGANDATFNPTDDITREDLITVLWRFAKENGYDVAANGFVMPDFPDVDKVDTWAAEAMCWAVRVGLIQGTGEGALNPKGTATRAEVAVMIDRFLKLEKAAVTK